MSGRVLEPEEVDALGDAEVDEAWMAHAVSDLIATVRHLRAELARYEQVEAKAYPGLRLYVRRPDEQETS